MLSKPALVAVVAAMCAVGAGTGAFLAVRQNASMPSAAAAPLTEPAADAPAPAQPALAPTSDTVVPIDDVEKEVAKEADPPNRSRLREEGPFASRSGAARAGTRCRNAARTGAICASSDSMSTGSPRSSRFATSRRRPPSVPRPSVVSRWSSSSSSRPIPSSVCRWRPHTRPSSRGSKIERKRA